MTNFSHFSPFGVLSFSKYLKSYGKCDNYVQRFQLVILALTILTLQTTELIYIHTQLLAIYQAVHAD